MPFTDHLISSHLSPAIYPIFRCCQTSGTSDLPDFSLLPDVWHQRFIRLFAAARRLAAANSFFILKFFYLFFFIFFFSFEFRERNRSFSELRTCRTRVRPSPFSEPRFGPVLFPNSEPARVRRKELAFLRTSNLPNQGWSRSFFRTPNPGERNWPFYELRTCRTRVRPSSYSELRTCPGSELRERNWPFSELRTCRTRVIPVLSSYSKLKLRTPGKNPILDHLGCSQLSQNH